MVPQKLEQIHIYHGDRTRTSCVSLAHPPRHHTTELLKMVSEESSKRARVRKWFANRQSVHDSSYALIHLASATLTYKGLNMCIV